MDVLLFRGPYQKQQVASKRPQWLPTPERIPKRQNSIRNAKMASERLTWHPKGSSGFQKMTRFPKSQNSFPKPKMIKTLVSRMPKAFPKQPKWLVKGKTPKAKMVSKKPMVSKTTQMASKSPKWLEMTSKRQKQASLISSNSFGPKGFL